jgi:hypothetical protein
MQLGVYILFCVAVLGIVFWVFPVASYLVYILVLLAILLGVFLFFKWKDPMVRLVGISLYGCILLNLVLNAHFYPSLLKYQGGSAMADRIEEEALDVDTLYKLSEQHSWALDFYFGKPLQVLSAEDLAARPGTTWVYVDPKEKESLRGLGIRWDREFTVDQFRISRLQARFLNPLTRSEVLRKKHLLRIPGVPR